MVDDPDDLDPLDLYDELTRRRIDRLVGRLPARRVGVVRRAAGGGALLTAVALGLQEALDPADDEAVVEELRPGDDADLPAVVLYLVPGAPARSRALVRPWLL